MFIKYISSHMVCCKQLVQILSPIRTKDNNDSELKIQAQFLSCSTKCFTECIPEIQFYEKHCYGLYLNIHQRSCIEDLVTSLWH